MIGEPNNKFKHAAESRDRKGRRQSAEAERLKKRCRTTGSTKQRGTILRRKSKVGDLLLNRAYQGRFSRFLGYLGVLVG